MFEVNDTLAEEMPSLYQNVVGLVPAGGQATRIAPLPCSKEVYPIGFRAANDTHSVRPKVVCQYLLEKMRLAGINKVYIVLRQGKWDIPAYLGDGSMMNMHLAYLMMHLPYGPPYTLDQAYPFVRDAMVAFGFPDILFQPEDAYAQLLARQVITNADIVLGLFPTHGPQQTDMVDRDEDGRVRSISIKPLHTHLQYAWILAVWNPIFTSFMHEYVSALRSGKNQEPGADGLEHRELSVGHVFQAAIQEGLAVQAVMFPNHNYLDIGTPEALIKAVTMMGNLDPTS